MIAQNGFPGAQYPYPQPQIQAPTPTPIGPDWNREQFRDAWMSSGVRNVNDMNNWLQSSGWGQHVGTGGSKGDKMYLPNGDVIDAVYGAGAGGNLSGPQWTGSGNWQQQGREEGPQQQQGIGPSQNMMGPWMQQWGRGGYGMNPQMMNRGNMMNQGMNFNPQDMYKQQQTQMHRQFQSQQQNRMQNRPGMMQQRQRYY